MRIRNNAPINPMITPMNCFLRKLKPKKNVPTSKVFSGVSEFRIDTIELSILCTAKEKRKAEGFIGFGAVTDVKFRGQVAPGDRLLIIGKMKEMRGTRRAVGLTQGFVDGNMVFEACVTGMLL